jgi:hypothetical protein
MTHIIKNDGEDAIFLVILTGRNVIIQHKQCINNKRNNSAYESSGR